MAIKEIFTVEEANVFLVEGLLWFSPNDGRKWCTDGVEYEWSPLHATEPPWSSVDYGRYRCGIMLEE